MVDINELAGQAGALAGVFIGATVAGLIGYFRKRPQANDPVLAGVGIELGSRGQMDMLIAALNRIGDILENKKQSAMEAKLQDILERLDRAER